MYTENKYCNVYYIWAFSNFSEPRNHLKYLLEMQFPGTYHLRLGLSRFEAQEPTFIISIPNDSHASSPRTIF